MSTTQTAESFWARVGIRGAEDCWPFLGTTNAQGYGNVAWNGRVFQAHRVAAWLCRLVVSPAAPKDRSQHGFVLHGCDNPICCNPGHFEISTLSKNQKDAYARELRTPMWGVNSPNAKLSAGEVRAIRSRYAEGGVTQNALAQEFGVTQTVIGLVTRGKTYKWI